MLCESGNPSGNYVPPPIGNGDLSVQIDMEGIQKQKRYHGMTPGIYRAGRRYDTYIGELISFGHIDQVSPAPESWRQKLNVETATISTTCTYPDKAEICTEAFVHPELPVLMIKKKFTGKKFTLKYILSSPDDINSLPARMGINTSKNKNGVDISYTISGIPGLDGIISLWTDAPESSVEVGDNQFAISVTGNEATFYLSFHDKLDTEDFIKANCELKAVINNLSYSGLMSSNKAKWGKYYNEGYVKLPDRKLDEVYRTSQYHLKISSTKWSIPTGIFPTHWQGKYFAFDDFFSFMGLLTTGHLSTAKKIPGFRHKHLQKALDRAHRYFGENLSGARFNWQTTEDGSEAASPSFWLEHIFHLASIALSAWEYYRYSGDTSFLAEEGYPVIANCAVFYETQAIYRDNKDKYYIGKCTDLERLGPGRERAFMTTCGVVATLEAAAAAAGILNIDPDKAEQWNSKAANLKKNLPHDGKKYVPYPECEESSIAVFAGKYPYDTLSNIDPLQLSAINDFLEHENEYGNMYPVGHSVCAWYAGWKGVAFARLGLHDLSLECIEQAAAGANCFSEIFEISDPVSHPWFTTAEGAYIHMVNESLIQSSQGEIRITGRDKQDYEFKLAAVGGVTVGVKARNGTIIHLVTSASKMYQGKILLPDKTEYQVSLSSGEEIQLI